MERSRCEWSYQSIAVRWSGPDKLKTWLSDAMYVNGMYD